MIDTHCHLKYFNNEELKLFWENINKMSAIVNIGTTIHDNWEIYNSSKIYSGFGIHPCDVASTNIVNAEEYLHKMMKRSDCICVGETGIDLLKATNLEQQSEFLHLHCIIAQQYNKTLIIHSRNVDINIILQIVSKYTIRFIFHSYSYGPDSIQKLIDYGGYGSFSGMLTFGNTDHILQSLKLCPIEHILTETDAPYLTPVPLRGKKNYPHYVEYVYKTISKVKNIPYEELLLQIQQNFCHAFNKMI